MKTVRLERVKFLKVVEDAKVLRFPSSDYEKELRKILDTQVIGDFSSDQGLWDRATKFILSDAPRDLKKKALAKIDQITGEELGLTDRDLDDFIDFVRDDN